MYGGGRVYKACIRGSIRGVQGVHGGGGVYGGGRVYKACIRGSIRGV